MTTNYKLDAVYELRKFLWDQLYNETSKIGRAHV